MIKARVKETSTTTGTGTLNLDGSVMGFRSFVNGFGTGQPCYYVIIDGTAWEVGIGIITSGSPDTLTRDTVLDSSAAGAKLSLGSGTKSIFNDMPAAFLQMQVRSFREIYGLTYLPNATDAVNDIDIASGGCSDATGVKWIQLSALTKRSDAAWAVGNNAGGLDTGSIGNNDYYIWAILRSDTGVTDYLYSLSSTAPTMPANYDFKRLIGWFIRRAGTIMAFHTYEIAGGGLDLAWDIPTMEVDVSNALTTSRRTDAMKVPLNLSVMATIIVRLEDAVTRAAALIYCPDLADLVPSEGSGSLALPNAWCSPATSPTVTQLQVRTSSTGTIAARSILATVDRYSVSTMGFTWARRN